METVKHIISLGAGVQSSTMALMAATGEITPMPECAVFADTQAEPESVYQWLDWLETQLPFPVFRVTKGDLSVDALKISVSKEGKSYLKTFLPTYQHHANHHKGMLWRKCTAEYKIRPLQQFVRRNFKTQGVRISQWLGISTDESVRMKDSRVRWIENRYPLIELNFSRSACLDWMKAMSFPTPPRSACWFCPFHSDNEWLKLKRMEPREFAKAVQFERDLQIAQTKQESLKTVPFLHASTVPLDQVVFKHEKQQSLFGNECEGFCGT